MEKDNTWKVDSITKIMLENYQVEKKVNYAINCFGGAWKFEKPLKYSP